MNPKSASALNGGAVIALVLGMAVMSPSGGFLCFVIGTLMAIFPALFGAGAARLAAAVLSLFGLLLSWQAHDGFSREMAAYSERARARAAKQAPAPPVAPTMSSAIPSAATLSPVVAGSLSGVTGLSAAASAPPEFVSSPSDRAPTGAQ